MPVDGDSLNVLQGGEPACFTALMELCFRFSLMNPHFEGWAQDYGNSNIFLKPLFRGNLDPFVNNANLGAIAHMSSGT